MSFHGLVQLAANLLEAAGVLTIIAGAAFVPVYVLIQSRKGFDLHRSYRQLRHGIGHAILLGLELLVGADIIRTVSEIPSLEEVVVLALVILIRTFLSFTLEVELEGRWPWNRPTTRAD